MNIIIDQVLKEAGIKKKCGRDMTGRVLPDTYDDHYYKMFGLKDEGYAKKLKHHKKELVDEDISEMTERKEDHKQAIRFYNNQLGKSLHDYD